MEKVAFVLPANADESAEAEQLKKNVYTWLAWLDAKKMATASRKLFKSHPDLESFNFNVSWEYDDEGGSKLEVYAAPEMKMNAQYAPLPKPMGIESELRSFVRQYMTPALYHIFVYGENGIIKTYSINQTEPDQLVKDFEPANIEETQAHARELNLLSIAAPAIKKKSSSRRKP